MKIVWDPQDSREWSRGVESRQRHSESGRRGEEGFGLSLWSKNSLEQTLKFALIDLFDSQ